MNFKTGDRVCYSVLWLDTLADWNRERMRLRVGTVVGNPQHPRAKLVHIKWDDNRAIYGVGYSPSFIEKFEPEIIELPPEDYAKFLDAIENPKPPNAALIKLMMG